MIAHRIPDRSRWSGRAVYTLGAIAVIGAVSLVGYFARTVYRDMYDGIPPSIPLSSIVGSCHSDDDAKCDVIVVRLNPGRFQVRTRRAASSVTVTVGDASAIARSRVLLLRTEEPGRLVVDAETTARASRPVSVDVQKAAERTVIRVADPAPDRNRITFIPTSSRKPIVIDELGFFDDDRGLLKSTTQPFARIAGQRFYATYAAGLTFAVCVFLVMAAWLTPVLMNRIGPYAIAVLCFAICILEVGTTFSPYWSRDLRSFYGVELIESGSNGNLTGGLYVGSRLIQGLGLTEPPGIVPWHRMPGYGLFCGFAAFVGRTTDVVEIALVVIVLQMILYSVTVGVFVGVAHRVFSPWMASLLGVLIALLPKQLHHTQVDSIIAPISLLVLTALLVHLAEAEAGGPPRFRTFLLVNAALALWFLMRNDILPGWIVLSVVLAGRRWRYMALPAVLMVTIALPWALYKRQYRHEFNLMPTNAGEVLFLSLCEVPGAFPRECTDDGYFDWASRISQSDPTSQRASNLAVAEVLRHWVTYPVHFGFMVWSKFRQCVFAEAWPGVQTRLNRPYGILGNAGLFVFLLAVVAVSLAVNHERRRSFLLGWALFFNMPIFFVVYKSSGRFYPAAGVSVLVAAIPLLFERGLYSQMARHPWRVVAVVSCVVAFVVLGRPVEHWILTNDALHYWAPWLDPGKSTLRFASD